VNVASGAAGRNSMPPTNTFFVDVHSTPFRYKQSSGAFLSTSASNGPSRTDFAHGYTNATAGSNPGTVVVDDGVDSPLIVVVVDELASGMVDEVGAGEEVVEVEGSDVSGRVDVSGRIVSPGAMVATGFVVVVSPEAERFVVPLAHAANRRPQESASAIAPAKRRC